LGVKERLPEAGQVTFADADAYVDSLLGWQRGCVENLRAEVRSACKADETIKWGHLVYASNGPVLLIRAEAKRVLLGFWRGLHLREIEPRLKPGGKYEMATLELDENARIDPVTVRRLVKKAVALNRTLGDPRLAATKRTPP
jgi:hypothetical protein